MATRPFGKVIHDNGLLGVSENDFDLHENETEYRTHFHMKGFPLRLVLKQRHKRTRKRPIGLR